MTPFIVAEMSANHLGNFRRAMAIVDAAAEAGADAIKLQTWKPGTMCISDYTLDHGPWKGRKLRSLYEEAHTPWEWHRPLFDRARKLGMIPFSAAFDRESVDFLETLEVDRHKVASFELVDLPLIRHMASKRKPMILSMGMATESEVVDALEASSVGRTTLLRCVSAYPATAEDSNLGTLTWIRDFGSMWNVEWPPAGVGISDHSLGIGVAVAAAALGATMIEKHLTLSRLDGGPDAGFSMEPHEFKQMVVECRRAAAAIGEVKFGPGPNESTELRRSLWVTQDVKAGDVVAFGRNTGTARPALGLAPGAWISYEGAVFQRDVARGTPFLPELVL